MMVTISSLFGNLMLESDEDSVIVSVSLDSIIMSSMIVML